MKIGALKETAHGENRVSMTPDSAVQLQKLGHQCFIQSGAGVSSGFSDDSYTAVGVTICKTIKTLYKNADILTKVTVPTGTELSKIPGDKTLISFFNPAGNPDLLEQAKKQGTNIIAMEMVPRISRAQKMDALSSMANIAGYRCVIEAGNNFGRFFTGQVTAAGKIPPAKVLVIGAGVAGLAAIGTATSLGAVVRAFDVRPEVAEQIESMGAEFLFLDFDDGQDDAATGGYAAPSSPEFREKQLECFRQQAPDIDIVITTALIPNRPAPKLWLSDMVDMMKPGSVIIDLAAERGGNCDVTIADKRIVTDNGVIVIGYTDFPSRMATQSSMLYSTNIRHMIADLTPEKDGVIVHDMQDDVIRGATAVYGGEITFPPPPPKIQAIASTVNKQQPQTLTPEQIKAQQQAKNAQITKRSFTLIGMGIVTMILLGMVAPASFMQHVVVFVLSCFVGYQVIWKVSHALHTPLMAVTNAISGIIVIGAVLQIGTSNTIITILAFISVLISAINISGGFLVTRRMLAMFKKS